MRRRRASCSSRWRHFACNGTSAWVERAQRDRGLHRFAGAARDHGYCARELRRYFRRACHPQRRAGPGASDRAKSLACPEDSLVSPGRVEKCHANSNFRKGYCLGEIGAAPLPALGSENLISSASRVLFLGVAWMTTRSPVARSPPFPAFSSFLPLDTKPSIATYFPPPLFPS